jgi:hypothetical protein
MTSRADEYALTSRKLLAKAQEALAQDNLPQASDKLWSAACHMVKGIAQRRGWRHNDNRDLCQIVSRLALETGDKEINDLFSIGIALYMNSHEDWMPREFVVDGLGRVRRLLQKLEGLPQPS